MFYSGLIVGLIAGAALGIAAMCIVQIGRD